jgi:outer membrane protein W
MGVGFLNVSTERSVEVIGIKTSFEDSGMSGVIGVAIPLGKRVFGSVEISGSSIDLKKEVNTGSISGTASVKYAPVTIGVNIGYYLF